MTQRAILLCCIVLIGVRGASAAQDEKKEVTPADVRKAIAAFQKDSSGKEGKAAAGVILLFAIQSKDVVVIVGKEESAWLGLEKDKNDENTSRLMAAYVAGSVLAQLDAKKPAHDMYAGLRQVFQTYQQVQKEDQTFKRPELDKLQAMDKEGKLKAHVAEIQEKRGDRKLDK